MDIQKLNPKTNIDLTVVIPALDEAENLAELLPQIRQTLEALSIHYDIIVVDEHANEQTRAVLNQYHANLLCPDSNGYGRALWAGMKAATGQYIATMDADNSHPSSILAEFWQVRDRADILIASRYVPGGKAEMPFSRHLLSKILNLFFGWGFGLRVGDLSSGYRMYDRKVVDNIDTETNYFEIQQEILIKAHFKKFKIHEVPFIYHPRRHGASHARVLKFGMAYLRLFTRLWLIRLTRNKNRS